MKKNVFNNRKLFCSAAIVAAAVTLSSCLEGGGNSVRQQTAGVVRLDLKSFKNVLDVSAYEAVYSPAFANMEEGTCCYIYYELDYELPENASNAVAANGYYTVTVMDKTEVDRYHMSSVADTSSVALPDETPVIDPRAEIGGYVKGIIFLIHQIKSPEDQKTNWMLSYDRENPYKTENGENIYDVYLRAVVRIPGTKTSEERHESCAYDMTAFIEGAALQEKSRGKDVVAIRFNYVSSINEDGTVVWSKTDKTELGTAMIIPETAAGSAGK
ncbi:MAG: hypothetical protein LBP64_00335 [Tannerella sp.]|jgi:hypothetical protein|nr:hypothetical protein [Tannerella sp.]